MYQHISRKYFACFALIVLILALIACGESSTATESTVAASSTSASTTAASIPASQPKQGSSGSSHPMLGSSLAAFSAAYGQPQVSNTQMSGYTFNWEGGHSNLIVLFADKQAVDIAITDPPHPWSQKEAIATCLGFAPSDAVFQKSEKITSDSQPATERIYYSAQLATMLPSGDFIDANMTQTKPGTFSIILESGDGGPPPCETTTLLR
jgi:hypothetical protein